MNIVLPTNKVPFTLVVGITCPKPELIKISAKDFRKPYTFYQNRRVEVKGERKFDIKMPQTPKVLDLIIYNTKFGNLPEGKDVSFGITSFDVLPIKENPIWLTDKDIEFIRFAQWFSENASILSAGEKIPNIYRSNKANFTIDYYNKIFDRKTGQFLHTPARIGHTTGTIEVSKTDFLQMTVPMRMIILLHEYCHKYVNPEIGRDIRDEVAADINACRMYLSLGYSEIEAHHAYLNVFNGARSMTNHKRYLILKDFIHKFNNGDFDNVTTDYVQKKVA